MEALFYGPFRIIQIFHGACTCPGERDLISHLAPPQSYPGPSVKGIPLSDSSSPAASFPSAVTLTPHYFIPSSPPRETSHLERKTAGSTFQPFLGAPIVRSHHNPVQSFSNPSRLSTATCTGFQISTRATRWPHRPQTARKARTGPQPPLRASKSSCAYLLSRLPTTVVR